MEEIGRSITEKGCGVGVPALPGRAAGVAAESSPTLIRGLAPASETERTLWESQPRSVLFAGCFWTVAYALLCKFIMVMPGWGWYRVLGYWIAGVLLLIDFVAPAANSLLYPMSIRESARGLVVIRGRHRIVIAWESITSVMLLGDSLCVSGSRPLRLRLFGCTRTQYQSLKAAVPTLSTAICGALPGPEDLGYPEAQPHPPSLTAHRPEDLTS